MKQIKNKRVVSKETREKISNTLKGHKVSEETREKIRQKNIHYRPTEDVKKRISLALAGKYTNEKSHMWKGDDVGYQALHTWLRKTKGPATRCQFQDKTCKGKFEWSNISKEYKRDFNDFQQLCSSHHTKYDRKDKI